MNPINLFGSQDQLMSFMCFLVLWSLLPHRGTIGSAIKTALLWAEGFMTGSKHLNHIPDDRSKESVSCHAWHLETSLASVSAAAKNHGSHTSN